MPHVRQQAKFGGISILCILSNIGSSMHVKSLALLVWATCSFILLYCIILGEKVAHRVVKAPSLHQYTLDSNNTGAPMAAEASQALATLAYSLAAQGAHLQAIKCCMAACKSSAELPAAEALHRLQVLCSSATVNFLLPWDLVFHPPACSAAPPAHTQPG